MTHKVLCIIYTEDLKIHIFNTRIIKQLRFHRSQVHEKHYQFFFSADNIKMDSKNLISCLFFYYIGCRFIPLSFTYRRLDKRRNSWSSRNY